MYHLVQQKSIQNCWGHRFRVVMSGSWGPTRYILCTQRYICTNKVHSVLKIISDPKFLKLTFVGNNIQHRLCVQGVILEPKIKITDFCRYQILAPVVCVRGHFKTQNKNNWLLSVKYLLIHKMYHLVQQKKYFSIHKIYYMV